MNEWKGSGEGESKTTEKLNHKPKHFLLCFFDDKLTFLVSFMNVEDRR